jgi:hypothetical protein
MTRAPLSRNPFADPQLLSLADLLDRLRLDRELPATRRQNMMWALKTIARVTNKEPADIVAHPEFLRIVLKEAAPESIGLSRAAWNNARSLLGKSVNSLATTTPFSLSTATPLRHVCLAYPCSAQEGPARVAQCPDERGSGARGRFLCTHVDKPGWGSGGGFFSCGF